MISDLSSPRARGWLYTSPFVTSAALLLEAEQLTFGDQAQRGRRAGAPGAAVVAERAAEAAGSSGRRARRRCRGTACGGGGGVVGQARQAPLS